MKRILLLLTAVLAMSIVHAADYPGLTGFEGKSVFVDDEGFPVDAQDAQSGRKSFAYGFVYGTVPGEELPVAIITNVGLEVPEDGAMVLPSFYNIVDPELGTLLCKVVGIEGNNIFGHNANGDAVVSLTLPTSLMFLTGSEVLNCPNLTALTLPASLEYMDVKALNGCISITDLTLADGDTPLNILGTQSTFYGTIGGFGVPPIVNAYLGKTVIAQESPFKRVADPTLKHVTLGGYGQPIYDNMFYNQKLLETAILKEGVGSIGKNAFANCPKLTGISIPGSAESIGQSAFENDSLMTTLTLAEGIKTIDYNAFLRCKSIKSVTLPASLDSISSSAFTVMSGVTSFTIADGDTPLKVYGTRFYGNGLCNDFAPYVGHLGRDLTLTQGALSPFHHASNDVGGLTKLTIGDKVTSLPENAFCESRNLATATIGTGLTAIPKQAFINCVKLNGISIPGNVKTIGQSAFENDSTMTTLTLGEGVKAIDYGAFLRCSKVQSITLPASLDSISSSAFTVMSGVTAFTIADGDTPLKVYGTRYYGNGLCNDFAPYVGHLGRDLTLTQGALSPFHHASNDVGGLTKLTIGDKVTTLPENAFSNNRNLATATIGTGLTAIPKQAFVNCVKLNGISIPGNVKTIGQSAFANDSTMTTLTLGEGVKAIDYGAFQRCSKVQSITLPASLDSIHADALSFMNGVTSFTIADNNKPLKVYSIRYWNNGMCNDFAPYEGYLGRDLTLTQNAISPFYHASNDVGGLTKLTIGNQVTTLPEYAFRENRNLATATIGTGLTAIPKQAFINCVKLNGISIPGNVKTIGQSAFANDSTMTTLTLGEGVKAIDYGAFQRCSKVQSITLPASLDSIHADALSFMNGVTSFTIADSNKPLKVYSMRYWNNGMCNDFAPYVGHLGRDLTLTQGALSPFYHASNDVGGLTKLTIGNQVTTLPENAFCENRNLATATIGTGLTAIPKQAFVNCVKLQGISIPGNVKTIGQSAFANDSTMTTLTLGEGVKAIDYDAFQRCSKVQSVTLPASLDSISSSAFTVMSGVTAFTIADGDTPLKVYGTRYYGNGLCNDFALEEAYVGRDFTLTQGALSPFYNQQRVTEVTLGSPVTTLGANCFYNCKKLARLTSNAVEPPVCATTAFASLDTKAIALTVPQASKGKYKAAPVWKDFFYEDDQKPGDVDGNGVTNGSDVTALYNILLSGDGGYNAGADVDGNGVVNGSDVTALYNLLLQ